MLLLTAGCGGGGGGGGSADSGLTLSGVASMGAPLTEADVLLVSLSSGAVYFASSKTGTDGSFTLNLNPSSYPPPYILKISGTSDQQASVYSYVTSDTTKGIVVTPFTTAAVALAAGSDPEAAFLNRPNLMGGLFVSKLQLIYQSGQNIFNQLGVTSPMLLSQNAAYKADGTGADLALDALKINYSINGTVNIATKFASQTLSLTSNSTTSDATALPINALLATKIVDGVNANNACLSAAFNSNVTLQVNNCLEAGFKDAGINSASELLSTVRGFLSNKTITSTYAASLNWCDFDDTSLHFGASAAALANKTGICVAKSKFVASGQPLTMEGYYKFRVSASGADIASVKMYGNQLNDQLAIYPAMEKKIRLDGLVANTGVTSGFKLDIGTGHDNGAVSVYSAKVEFKNSSGMLLPSGTFYLQCQQNLGCQNSILSICSDSTCASTDNKSSAIVSTNTAITANILSAMQSGPVRATITAYDNLMNSGAKNVVYQKVIPIVNLPIDQATADSLSFPTLSASSMNTLKNWRGGNFSTSFSAGSAASIQAVNFYYNGNNSTKFIPSGSTSASHTGIGTGFSPLVTGCATASDYRSYELAAVVADVPMTTKYFGSCNQGDY